MCRGGSISCLLAAAAISVTGCVDADNATPSSLGTAPNPVVAAPKAGTTASVAPTGVGGTIAPTTTPATTTPATTIPTTTPTTTPSGVAGMAAGGAGGSAVAGGAGGSAGAGGAKAGSGGAGGAAGAAAGGAGGAGGSGGGATAPKFGTDVYPILMSKCAACHGASGGLMLGSKDAAYMNLMANSTTCSGMKRVVPNMPDMSVVVQAIKGAGCRMNRRMPPAPGAMLDAASVTKITDWIMGGAKND